jgi:hypothetical protein
MKHQLHSTGLHVVTFQKIVLVTNSFPRSCNIVDKELHHMELINKVEFNYNHCLIYFKYVIYIIRGHAVA